MPWVLCIAFGQLPLPFLLSGPGWQLSSNPRSMAALVDGCSVLSQCPSLHTHWYVWVLCGQVWCTWHAVNSMLILVLLLLLFCCAFVLQAQQVQQRSLPADGLELFGFSHPLVAMLIQVGVGQQVHGRLGRRPCCIRTDARHASYCCGLYLP